MTKERRKKSNLEYTKEDYERASELVCPNKRGKGYYWITLYNEPCIKENCSWGTCHLYGKKIEDYSEYDQSRLIIVKEFRSARGAMFAGLTGGEDEEEDEEEILPLSVVCYDLSNIVSAKR